MTFMTLKLAATEGTSYKFVLQRSKYYWGPENAWLIINGFIRHSIDYKIYVVNG